MNLKEENICLLNVIANALLYLSSMIKLQSCNHVDIPITSAVYRVVSFNAKAIFEVVSHQTSLCSNSIPYFEEQPILFTGLNCESRTQKFCFSHPCANNGTCHENETAYECNCTYGFTGKNCNTEVNQCLAMSCENNSTCIRVSAAQYKCHCAEGFGGNRCEFLHTVNFDKMSYMALPSTVNRVNYSIMFSFTTTVRNGSILYQGKVSYFVHYCAKFKILHVK